MIRLLRWFFSTSGIQFTTMKPVIRLTIKGRNLLFLNPLPGVQYRPQGPTLAEQVNWGRAGRYLKDYTCVICGTKVWSWKKVRVCGRVECFMRNGGKWR